MGRFSSLVLVLLAACGDNLDTDGVVGADQAIDPDGVSDPSDNVAAREVPSVCSSQSWTNITANTSMQVSVAPTPYGAVVLSTPRTGGELTGFVYDMRSHDMQMNKLGIPGTFTSVSASVLHNRVVSTAVEGNAVFLHTLDDDLGNPQYTAKMTGRLVAEPAFFDTRTNDLVMPIAGDDGLWLHRFYDSFEPNGSKQVLATAPALSMGAAQMRDGLLISWSTANDCYIMATDTFEPGRTAHIPAQCNEPRMAVHSNGLEAVMVFDSEDGARIMNIFGTQFGGDARVMRPATSSPRVVFDGSRFWISYIDERGDLLVGFLDENRKLVTMSLAGPKPESQSYDLVMVDGSPWVVSLDTEGYAAYRMCLATL
jgi:hypothetical protein